MGFFGLFETPPELKGIKELEAVIKKLKFKIGEVGSYLAINQEKGMPEDTELARTYAQTRRELLAELTKLKSLLQSTLQYTQDGKVRDYCQKTMARTEASMDNLINS